MSDTVLSKIPLFLRLSLLLLPLGACTDQFEQSADNPVDGDIAMQVPNAIRHSRIDAEDLSLTVTVDGAPVPMSREGEQWSGSVVVPYGQAIQMSATWSSDGVSLATLDQAIPAVTTNQNITTSDDDYDYTDDDGDDISNLAELDASPPTSISDPNSFPPVEGIRYLGVVFVEEEVSADTEVELFGDFGRYSRDISESVFASLYTIPELDTCTVGDSDSDFPSFDVTSISAGDVLTLTSGAGTYAQMAKSDFFGSIQYSSFVPGRLPSRLSLDVPGEEFPAFSNINLPVVESIAVSMPTMGQAVTPDTRFAWTASSQTDTYIAIYVENFAGTGNNTSVFCLAKDDGEFEFPPAVKNELGTDFSTFEYYITRGAVGISQQNDALLITYVESYTYGTSVIDAFLRHKSPLFGR